MEQKPKPPPRTIEGIFQQNRKAIAVGLICWLLNGQMKEKEFRKYESDRADKAVDKLEQHLKQDAEAMARLSLRKMLESDSVYYLPIDSFRDTAKAQDTPGHKKAAN